MPSLYYSCSFSAQKLTQKLVTLTLADFSLVLSCLGFPSLASGLSFCIQLWQITIRIFVQVFKSFRYNETYKKRSSNRLKIMKELFLFSLLSSFNSTVYLFFLESTNQASFVLYISIQLVSLSYCNFQLERTSESNTILPS